MIRIVLIGLLLLLGCGSRDDAYKAKVQDPAFLHRSLKQITDCIVYDIFGPTVSSRIYAYASIAAYEAVRHQDPSYQSLAGQLQGLEPVPEPDQNKEYCFPLASVEAMLKVGRALVFSEDKMDAFHEQILKEFKDAGLPDEVFDNSIAYGQAVAKHIMAWSSKDNYKQTRSFPKYTILSDPGTWKPTPPAYMDALEPHWNDIRPLVIDSANQFKPSRPTEFSMDEGSLFFNEAEDVYKIGTNLTEEQKHIASFWDCNPFVMHVRGHVMFATKKISPGGHWMSITRIACEKVGADPVRSADAYAKVAVALFDGFISCWDEKFRSKLIRPETYINQYIDENWTPFLQTPPFPEYTSGHSVISSAAAVMLTDIFGENFAFADSTESEYGIPPRSFTSFIQASEEAAVSRIYGGIHYRPACYIGIEQGRTLGRLVADRLKTRTDGVAKAD